MGLNPVVNYKSTFVLPHSGAVKAIMDGIVHVYEAGVEFPMLGGESFKQNYPWHTLGLVFNYSSLSNQEILGSSYSFLPYIRINVLRNRKSKWTGRMGSGIAYIEKPFDPETNFKNFVIGSYINNITDLQIAYSCQYKKSILDLGIGIQHFSNGSLKRPNLGINLPYFNIGYRFGANQHNHTLQRDTTIRKNTFYIASSYGFKNIDPGIKEGFSVVQFAGGYTLNFKRHRSLHLQIDFIRDWSIPYLKNYNYKLSAFDSWIIGSFVIYEKRFGNIGLLAGSGYYLHSVYHTFDQDWSFANKGGRFYNRVGAKYYFGKIYTQFAIKAHMGEADNFEFGLGYNFK